MVESNELIQKDFNTNKDGVTFEEQNNNNDNNNNNNNNNNELVEEKS